MTLDGCFWYNSCMEIIATDYTYECRYNCFGNSGYHGSCCRVEDRDYILGPCPDTQEMTETLNLRYEDMYMDFEEGSKLYPDKPSWQNPENYPTLRVDSGGNCIFYHSLLRKCVIYEERPFNCRNYFCSYLKEKI